MGVESAPARRKPAAPSTTDSKIISKKHAKNPQPLDSACQSVKQCRRLRPHDPLPPLTHAASFSLSGRRLAGLSRGWLAEARELTSNCQLNASNWPPPCRRESGQVHKQLCKSTAKSPHTHTHSDRTNATPPQTTRRPNRPLTAELIAYPGRPRERSNRRALATHWLKC